jgi:hypothetical protein
MKLKDMSVTKILPRTVCNSIAIGYPGNYVEGYTLSETIHSIPKDWLEHEVIDTRMYFGQLIIEIEE